MTYSNTSNSNTSKSSSSSSSSSQTRRSDSSSRMTLESTVSRGLPFTKCLKLAFRIGNETLTELSSHARRWSTQPAVASMLRERALEKDRDAVEESSIAELGNAFIERAIDEELIPKDRRVKMVVGSALNVEEGRTPNIAIVPASVNNVDLAHGGRFDWRYMLGALQVWQFPSRGTKRKDPIDSELANEPSSKRSRSRTAKDVSTSLQATAPAIVELDTDGATHNEYLARDHPTDVDGRSSSTWSSDSTLYRESGESELLSIFHDAFSTRGDRSFAIGACVYGTRIKLMFCSHSGIVESDEIDFLRNPELLAVLLLAFATTSPPHLGFNATTGFCNPFDIDDLKTQRVNVKFESFNSDNNQTVQPDLSEVTLDRKIVAHSGIVGRATVVYQLGNCGYSLNLVMKYSWQVKTHRREDEVIRVAREADPVHTPELFGTAVIEDDSPFGALRSCCSRKSKINEPRELRVLVMREYRPLSELGFGDGFWDAYVQLLGCVHKIFKKKGILHHDISMQNLAYYLNDLGKPSAVLIDFDLAILPPYPQFSEDERFGTVLFMARDLLLCPESPYDIQHDYESFLYCAIWHGLGYETNKKYPRKKGSSTDILSSWRTGSYYRMGFAKNSFLTSYDGNGMLRELPVGSYADKCKGLWRKFKETYRALSVEARSLEEPVPTKRSEADEVWADTRMTYDLMVKALNFEPEPCDESCCWQWRNRPNVKLIP